MLIPKNYPNETTPPPEFRPSGLPRRNRRLPMRYRDELPPVLPLVPVNEEIHVDLDSPNPPVQPHATDQPIPNPDPNTPLTRPQIFRSERNHYGLFKLYYGAFPSQNPDESTSIDQLCDDPNFGVRETLGRPWWARFGSSLHHIQSDYFAPFLNATTFRLMHWFYTGSNLKSFGELDRLVNDVILTDDFDWNHLQGFRASREAERLDNYNNGTDPDTHSLFHAEDGWIKTSVTIPLPAQRVCHASENDAPKFAVDNLFYRRPLQVVKAAFQEKAADSFHLSPFKSFWQPSDHEQPERVYCEVYSSDAMINEHRKIQSQSRQSQCNLETVVAAIMLWSDSTHLTSFGNASLWPVYLYIGNQSKYTRAKPTSFAAHHLAYLPKVGVHSSCGFWRII